MSWNDTILTLNQKCEIFFKKTKLAEEMLQSSIKCPDYTV